MGIKNPTFTLHNLYVGITTEAFSLNSSCFMVNS